MPFHLMDETCYMGNCTGGVAEMPDSFTSQPAFNFFILESNGDFREEVI
jgi:hypothetical protein